MNESENALPLDESFWKHLEHSGFTIAIPVSEDKIMNVNEVLEDIWAAANVKKDRTTEVKDMASSIHRELIKIISDPDIKNDPNLESTKRALVNSFLSTLQDDDGTKWDKDKIKEVRDQIWELDKETRRTLKRSLIEYTWTKMNNQYNENNQKLENLLKDKQNESTFELLNTIHGRENP